MLHDYVELFLELPRQDQDCPFLVARKREPSGLTKAYINHCKIMSAEESEPQQLRDYPWTSRLNLPALGLQPENPGTVEYDVISSVLDGKPAYAQATTSLRIRDPQFPRLPAIDSPSRECQASQLQASKLPTLDGGKWHAALIYNLTNISSQTCRLGGAPQLSFVHPAGKSYSAIPSACTNCADCSFPAAPERLD